ncbi:uncharacterized protein K02A2.6-like [Haliotis rufescens]|uniref:uncharacterized protein K02A2.6-like n=1 Tax=Haliotis rufescens TaxID=6454 RepID=UPI00201F7514|nr:uncharacterized protein K02A2.6-like [Haliotis rufescens]
MLLKLQWYDLTVKYRKGKDMSAADALSRAYVTYSQSDVVDLKVVNMADMISVSPNRYAEIKQCTKVELSTLSETILNGWPDNRQEAPMETRPYWDSRDQLSLSDCIIFKGLRIVVPPSLRSHMLLLIHESHLGMVKSKQRAREVMFWPGMNADIENIIRDCHKCAVFPNKQQSEPLMPTPPPDLPYQEVGCDLFDFQNRKYLVLVDYFSRYIDTVELNSLTTSATINAMEAILSSHGIPSKLRSDNGPQFDSREFKDFCKSYGIQHVTSSPHFQSSNGEAEGAVQTEKKLWKKSEDKHLALLDYRTTPLEGFNLSPAQLLMSRRPRNTLRAAQELLDLQSCVSPVSPVHVTRVLIAAAMTNRTIVLLNICSRLHMQWFAYRFSS